LGQRALKWFKGWDPGLCSWLRPKIEQMQEIVDRTNARMDSHCLAALIMRQISHMRELTPSSKKVRNAVVGNITPSMIEVGWRPNKGDSVISNPFLHISTQTFLLV
jgi:hypothetical protein